MPLLIPDYATPEQIAGLLGEFLTPAELVTAQSALEELEILGSFGAFLTNTGIALDVNSKLTGAAIKLTHIAVGSGFNDALNEATDELTTEQYRTTINNLYVSSDDAGVLIAEARIPPDVGGWHIREAGIFDSEGNLYAVAKMPTTRKVKLSEGASDDILVQLKFYTSNTANVTLKIDPAVIMASRAWVYNILMERDLATSVAQMMAAQNLLQADLMYGHDAKRDTQIAVILTRISSLEYNQSIIADRASRAVLN